MEMSLSNCQHSSPEQLNSSLSQENSVDLCQADNFFYPPIDQDAVLPNYQAINGHPQNCSVATAAAAACQTVVTKRRRAKRETGRPKRDRYNYKIEEVAMLEDYYQNSNFINKVDRLKLAERLNVNPHRVKVWFQNRRMKDKRENQSKSHVNKENVREFSSASLSSNASTPSPAQFQPNPSVERKISNSEIRDNLMQYRNYVFEPFIPQEPTISYQPYYGTYPMQSVDMYTTYGHQLSANEDISVHDYTTNGLQFDERIDMKLEENNIHEFDSFLQLNVNANAQPPIDIANTVTSGEIRHEYEQQKCQNVPYFGVNENRYHPTGTLTDISTYWRHFDCE